MGTVSRTDTGRENSAERYSKRILADIRRPIIRKASIEKYAKMYLPMKIYTR